MMVMMTMTTMVTTMTMMTMTLGEKQWEYRTQLRHGFDPRTMAAWAVQVYPCIHCVYIAHKCIYIAHKCVYIAHKCVYVAHKCVYIIYIARCIYIVRCIYIADKCVYCMVYIMYICSTQADWEGPGGDFRHAHDRIILSNTIVIISPKAIIITKWNT